MKYFIIFILTLFSINETLGQNKNDSIYYDSEKQKTQFVQDSRILKLREVKFILRSNPEAYNSFSKAEMNLYTAYTIQGIAGFFMGYTIGEWIASNEFNMIRFGASAAAFFLSVPFENAFRKNAKEAIEIHNQGLYQNSDASTLHFGFTSQGVGFTLQFQ